MALIGALSFRRRERVLLLVVLAFCILNFTSLPSNFGLPGLLQLAWLRYQPDPYADILRFVDPLIGTTNGGHVFPGATLPYGLAKAGADTDSFNENAAGFVSDNSRINGFSHMHDSGTGGAPSFGNFPLFVHPGCETDNYRNCTFMALDRRVHRVNDSVIASPGYFSINLTNTVRAEMTATHRTALYRFSFSPGEKVTYKMLKTVDDMRDRVVLAPVTVSSSPLILVDLNDLGSTRKSGGTQVYESGRVIGDGEFSPSFGMGHYNSYFCADFRGAKIRRSGIFNESIPKEHPKYIVTKVASFIQPVGSIGAWLQFERPESNQILARVGMSFISVDRACANAEKEIPDFNFESVVQAARNEWGKKLSVIQLDTTNVTEEMQTIFWSGLYRSMLSPQNYTGENPLWNSTEPYFDSFYCIWDSFRAQHPLLTIVDPVAQAEMVRTLLDVYRFVGKLPDCRMAFCKGYTQGGSNADVVITDAWVKNITDGIDWKIAYDAVISDAEDEVPDFSLEGRGNIESWIKLGYVAWDHHSNNSTGPHSRTVSRSLEYAYDDFCIATLARGLGHMAAEKKYMGRSGNWKKLWNPKATDLYFDKDWDIYQSNFTGFMQPRDMKGTWVYQNKRTCTQKHQPHLCYFDTSQSTYEGSPWLYSFYVPQDMASLIKTMGGQDAFIERLVYFHESGISYMGNEQGFLPTFQFHYGGRPGLSSYWVHQYIPGQFNTSLNGIPGNDDGAMGAFSTFAMIGLFPVAGQDVYLLTPPFFPEVRLKSRGPKPAIIRKVWADEADRDGIYIQSATLNGKPYTQNWITHEIFLKGGVLELTVGKEEGSWGTRDEDLPPSSSVPIRTKNMELS